MNTFELLKQLGELSTRLQADWDKFILSQAKEDPTLSEMLSLKQKELQNETTGKSKESRA